MRVGRVMWLVLLLVSSNVQANGINPPRPAGSMVLQAQCNAADGMLGMELYRAQVRVGQATRSTIETRGRDGVVEVPLDRWRTLSGLDGHRDKAGFVQARAAGRDGVEPARVAIRVRKDGQEVELTGFSKAGERVSVPLAKCSEVLVRSVDPSQPGGSLGPRAE